MVEDLSRRELQKLCGERKALGLLPEGAKCGAPTKDLIDILLLPLKSSLGNYENIIRSLAPYLTYDKLLLSAAYFPGKLLAPLRDPNNSIWTDRVWVELGIKPVSLKVGGIRYFHLHSARRSLPWGYLYYGRETKIRAQQATFYERRTDEENLGLFVWALTPRGLEFFSGTAETSEGLFGALNNPNNWILISSGTWVSLVSHSPKRAIVLGSNKILYDVHWNDEPFSKKDFQFYKINKGTLYRYLRETSWINRRSEYLYAIEENGPGVILSASTLTEKNLIRGSSGITVDPPEWYFQRFVSNPRDPKELVSYPHSLRDMRKIPKAPGLTLEPDYLYYLPYDAYNEDVLAKGGILYKDHVNNTVLGINGRLYTGKYIKDSEREPSKSYDLYEENTGISKRMSLYGLNFLPGVFRGIVW